MFRHAILSAALVMGIGVQTQAMTDLLVNPGFEDTDGVLPVTYGDGWGAYGAADFNNFFDGNAHASFYGDFAGNLGGVYQLAIPGSADTSYQFDLMNTRIESNFDADLKFGLEYYAGDDSTKLGETIVTVDTATRLANSQTDGNVFSMQGTAVPGTVYVRPIVQFDNVNPAYVGQSQANAFVFDAYLSEVPAPGGELLKNPGFGDENTDGNLGDDWGNYGSTGFNDFFGGNAHASFFADFASNSGGVYQQAVLGTPGTEYSFSLDDVRIEDNWDADLIYGLEFYGDDDYTKIGELLVTADTTTTGDGLSFDMTATAVPGTKYVRPVIQFANVNPAYVGQSLANLFVFGTSLTEVVSSLPGDLNGDGYVGLDDLQPILDHWNQNVTVGDTSMGDIAGPGGTGPDGYVGLDDLQPVLDHWNEGTMPTPSSIPEPAGLALLGLGGLVLFRRRG